jgi:uncharacterized protein YidB (DUF937 family)
LRNGKRNIGQCLPQGSGLAKPLVLAFMALLASGALTRKQSPASAPSASPTSGADAGGLLGGLGGLLEKLQQGNLGDVAKSWVGNGQNQPISPGSLGSALGPSIVKILAEKTGLSEQEVTAQLSQVLPGFVDKLTPQGRLPTHDELARLSG